MAEKVLVVDDDIDGLKLIGLMLQRNGYEVSAANSGGQALAKVQNDRPDLIILDVMMPDMSGYEVCRRLRKNPDTKSIPIIMFTAKTLIDDKVAGFEAGADDYLTKPTHPAELASRVKAVLARQVTQKPAAPVAVQRGATVGVLGAKGGVGTTTVALNLAAARLAAGDNPVVADFRLGMGSLGLALGFGRSHGMANVVIKPPQEINPRMVEPELVQHSSGLRALLSSARAKEAQANVTEESSVALVRALRVLARPGIFDLGSGLPTRTLRLQREMDQLLLIVDPLQVTLAMAREVLQELDANRPENNKTQVVVVNRAASSSAPAWHDVEQMLGREIRAVIALASELMSQSLQANMPAVLYQPTAIASSQMSKLAEEVQARMRSLTAEMT